jgi:cytochrome c
MFEPRYGYLGLFGAGLLLAYHIDANRAAPDAGASAVSSEAVAAVEQPAPAPAPAAQQQPDAAAVHAAADQAAAAKAIADQQAKAAADKAAAEQAAADKAAAAKAEAEKAAADKAAADKAAAEQAAAKAAADKLAAEKTEAAKAPPPPAPPANPGPAAPAPAVAAVATTSGPWDGGDAAAGQVIFHKCQLCHYGEKGRTKIGPSLWGVVGRHSGSLDGYHYSNAMASYNHVWTPENLFVYLQAPTKVVRGTKMTFIGLPNPTDRANVIAYLKTLQ